MGRSRPRRGPRTPRLDAAIAALPAPRAASCAEPYAILLAGIGGTGVVTASALISMAAHLEGRHCTSLDLTGIAVKNGAVSGHIRDLRRGRRRCTGRGSPPAAPTS